MRNATLVFIGSNLISNGDSFSSRRTDNARCGVRQTNKVTNHVTGNDDILRPSLSPLNQRPAVVPIMPTSKSCLHATPNITKTAVKHDEGFDHGDEKEEQLYGTHRSANSNCLEVEQGQTTQQLSTQSVEGVKINSGINDHEEWDLDEDWKLIDQVPLFTVRSTNSGSNSHTYRQSIREQRNTAVTFWTQLRHSTPLLSNRTEEELEKRYRMLYDQNRRRLMNRNDNNDPYSSSDEKMGVTTKKMIQGGASPEFLTDWWMEEHTRSSTSGDGTGTMMVGGVLMNGRKIWFPLNYAGTHHGISNRNYDEDRNHETLDFDYAEANGGCIYELGKQRKQMSKQRGKQLDAISDEITASPSFIKPWLLSKNGSIFAIITASVLSALIAFNSDPLQHQISSSTQAVDINSTPMLINVQRSQLTSSPSSSAISSARTTLEANELSISGQRARQELRVERDKKTIVRIQDKLKFDEIKLQELQTEEMREEAIEYGFAK